MKRTQQLTRLAAIVAGIALLVFFIVGALSHWAWAGFDKPLYDWMQLLIIPVVLALVAVWFNRIDKKNEVAIASDNQQESALQSYLDHMQELLLEKGLRESQPGDEVRNIARVRTLTMFYQLDARRTNYMLSFLNEAAIISEDQGNCIVSFNKANLRLASMHGVNLGGLSFSEANLSESDLSESILMKTNLSRARLFGANLRRTILNEADLSGADLSGANLSGSMLIGTNLSGADLSGANLHRTILNEADLSGADLSGANLHGALIMKTNLSRALINQKNLNKAHTLL